MELENLFLLWVSLMRSLQVLSKWGMAVLITGRVKFQPLSFLQESHSVLLLMKSMLL
jgi:hypothetical protein